jgi:hypothetical protein
MIERTRVEYSLAAGLVENATARLRPLAARSHRKVGESRRCQMASSSSCEEVGEKSSAQPPATSGSEAEEEQTTGVPQAMDSTTG